MGVFFIRGVVRAVRVCPRDTVDATVVFIILFPCALFPLADAITFAAVGLTLVIFEHCRLHRSGDLLGGTSGRKHGINDVGRQLHAASLTVTVQGVPLSIQRASMATTCLSSAIVPVEVRRSRIAFRILSRSRPLLLSR